jgi:hypothetical protein
MVNWNDPDHRLPDPRMVEIRQAYGGPGRRPATRPEIGDDDGEVVRPFIVTGGRTRPVDERLRMETMVTASPAALSAPLGFERRHIVELCQLPLSVAEIAVSLRVPLGVARVLTADLIAEGLLIVHAQITLGDRPSRELLERIRDGVRAL